MPYHAADLDGGLVEIVRVLGQGGRLVAVTSSEHHLATVEQIDVDGWVTFPDAESIRRYIRSMLMIAAASKADNVPDEFGLVRAGTRVTVFVAQRAWRVTLSLRGGPVLQPNP